MSHHRAFSVNLTTGSRLPKLMNIREPATRLPNRRTGLGSKELERFQERNQCAPIFFRELQAKLVTLDRTWRQMKSLWNVIGVQARRIEPFLQSFRLSHVTKRISVPDAA